MILSNRQREKLLELGFADVGSMYCCDVVSLVRAEDLGTWCLAPVTLTSSLVRDPIKGSYKAEYRSDAPEIVVQLLFVFVQGGYENKTMVFVASPSARKGLLKLLKLARGRNQYKFLMEAKELLARMSKQQNSFDDVAEEEVPASDFI